MKMRAVILRPLFVALVAFLGQQGFAQTGVLNPNDTVFIYNPNKPPVTPPANTLVKWVKTNRLNWNTTEYKCYFYNGIAFRLKFPKSYTTAVDGKTYPLYLFFHGVGEKGSTIYDNEYQLFHGGQPHLAAVDNGKFDGFLLYPQSTSASGGWGNVQYDIMYSLILNYLVPQVKVDINRINVDGLSGGGGGTWDFTMRYPLLVAGSLPISAASLAQRDSANRLKFTPIWLFQGGLDNNPAPSLAHAVRDAYLAVGGDFTYTEFPTRGHSAWDSAWLMPDYFPFMLRTNKANPWPLYGRLQYCPTDVISDTLGVTAGYDGYQWRKNGVVIPGANKNTLVVTSLGTYDCSILRGSTWSPWSPIPAVISIKGATVSPNIQVQGLASDVLPALDGSTSVNLQVPTGYVSYVWKRVDSPATLANTTNILTGATPGSYAVMVTEQFGCSSSFSNPFTVINANGPNPPDAPISLNAASMSQTKVMLSWSENPNPAFQETAFEVYSATSSAGPYKLIGFANQNVDTFPVTGLNAKTTYFFKVRAINNTAASASTPPANATTAADVTPPSAPPNLRATSVQKTFVLLAWDSAYDDVGVSNYDIYVNGKKSYSVGDQNNITVYNLNEDSTYAIAIKARDLAGNVSPFSNQIIVTPHFNGLQYKYYEGTFTALPDFNSMAALDSGFINNVIITNPQSLINYAYTWTGIINLPVTGSYTFETTSDDGSKLYIDTPYRFNATATVNNDGTHSSRTRSSTTKTYTAGPHLFTATYFQGTSTASVMSVLWKNPQTKNAFVVIPDSAFVEKYTVNGTAPNAPSGLTATATAYNKINLSWISNSTNETAFEIDRSTTPNSAGPFVGVGRTPAHVTSFVDSSGLQSATPYYYQVKAIGPFGTSKFNAQDTSVITYNYYETGSLTALPNFATLTPVNTGLLNNITLTGITNRGTNFAVTYDGFISITTAGKYTFYTSSDDGSQLFIDGTLIVNNDGGHSATEKSGVINSLSAGLHKIRVTYYQATGGTALTVSYAGPNITKQAIPSSVLTRIPVNATTLSLPGSPKAPTNLTTTATSPTKIQITWTDSNSIANTYQLYRSSNNNTNYVLLKTLPVNNITTVYIDSGLFSNAQYYYKVRSMNLSGNSPFSNESATTTLDNVPTIAPIANQTMHYGTQMQVKVVATSPDNQVLTTTFPNLPAFASVVSTGNGTATITFSPQQSDSGLYNGIIVNTVDPHNGSASTSFNLTVNDNYNPVIAGIANDSVPEGTIKTHVLTGTDQNPADSVRWAFSGLPAFVTPTINAGMASLNIAPGYSDAGTYTVSAIATDGRGGVDSESFNIVVNTVYPHSAMYIDFNSGTGDRISNPNSIWNQTNKIPALNDVYGPFKDSTGKTSTISLNMTSAWNVGNPTNESGQRTGNNSGVYPDTVMMSAYWTSTIPQSFNITGLDTSKNRVYSFTFFGSRGGVTDNRTTVYTANGISVSLNAANNSQNTVTINGLKPNAQGIIPVTLQNGTGSSFGYINAMVIHSYFNDSTAPVGPKNFAVTLSPQNTAVLSWTSAAYNDSSYQVYRATTSGGPFTLIATTAPNATGYTDASIIGNNTYYYEVNAKNNYGTSDFTPVLQLVIPNIPPVLAPIANQTLKGDAQATVSLSATFTSGDIVKLTAQNLPSFATLTDNGNGTGSILISPTNSQVGVYSNITVTATDNQGGVNSQTFTIIVKDKNITNININFNQTSPVGAPWNSFNAFPFANTTISNLKDENSSSTGISVTLMDLWGGSSEVGAVTGNNTGVFPDSVMKTTYFDAASTVHHIKLSGLSSANNYNLVFFGSRTASDTRITNYSAGGQTVSLNVSNNTSNTVQINGLSPDNTGSIDITVVKASAAPYTYINAMVIQSYTASNVPLSPTNLTAVATSRSTIKLAWSDRSNNETAFEIWRAPVVPGTTNLAGPLAKIDTVPANVTTYTNNNLPAGTNYLYEVRAKAGSTTFSDYSNQVYVATFLYMVYMNFNRDNPASAPWNNTNSVPNPGAVFSNLMNDQNNPSGINITVANNFDGDNPFGMNTGNNSGIFPDNVIDKTWWVSAGDTGILKIDGLNLAMSYNIMFFASRNGGAGDMTDRTTIYQIGNSQATLNATNNISQTTQINNIIPDSNGAVFVKVYQAPTSNYGYIGALVIQAANSFNAPVIVTGNRPGALNGQTAETEALSKIIPFPNPFKDNIKLNFSLQSPAEKVNVFVTDITGRTISIQELRNIPQGNSVQSLEISTSLKPGVYFIKVLGLPGGAMKAFKVVKE